MNSSDFLTFLHPDRWNELKLLFLNDWPKNILGYYALVTQEKWIKKGLDYGFKVYCPFGKIENGMVAINVKKGFYEIIIQCDVNATKALEEALIHTDVIDWTRKIIVAYTPTHVIEALHRAIPKIGTEIEFIYPGSTLVFNKERNLYEDLKLPQEVQIDRLREDQVDLIDSSWRYKYCTSPWYFDQIIKSGATYGLYENTELASWVTINELGNICNLFTVDKLRHKGYAEMLMKLVCNDLSKQGMDTLVYCLEGNAEASNLYKKLGFQLLEDVAWVYIKPISVERN